MADDILVRPDWTGVGVMTPGFRVLGAGHSGAPCVVHLRPGLDELAGSGAGGLALAGEEAT